MNVQKIPVQGTSQTTGDAPKRAIVVPLLPRDGAFSVRGTILAVDPGTRFSAEFSPRFGGSVVGGEVTENEMGASAPHAEDGGACPAWVPGTPRAIITGRQLEVALTGIGGKTIDWAWHLEVILFSLPASPTPPSATPGSATSARPAQGSGATTASNASAGTESP